MLKTCPDLFESCVYSFRSRRTDLNTSFVQSDKA